MATIIQNNQSTESNVDPRTGKPLRAGSTLELPVGGLNVAPVVTPNMSATKFTTTGLTTPTMTPDTTAIGGIDAIGGQAKTVQQQFQQELADKAVTAKKAITEDMTGIQGIYQKLFGQPDRQEQIYKDAGVDTALNSVNNYTSQIEQEQLSNRRRNEVLDNNKTGLFGGGLEQEKARINKESLSKQADLAVLQGAAARNYEAVSAAADRKVKAETDSLENELKAREFFYSAHKDEYDKADQQEYEQKNEQIKTEIENKKTGQEYIVKAVGNGAPTSVIQEAQKLYNAGADPTEIAAALGSYVGDIESGKNTQVVDVGGKKLLVNTITGETIREIGVDENNPQSTEQAQNQIDTIEGLLGNTKGLKASVGTTGLFGRGGNTDFGAARGDFQAGIQQLTSQLTLDNLLKAKADGATFGALSEGELGLLSATATKLNAWAKTDDKGNITGFKTSEANVIRELDKINNFAKKDYILKGGNPQSIGASVQPDGKIFSKNGDGTFTEIGTVAESKEKTSSSGTGKNPAQRNNNPLNIKASKFTQSFPGVSGVANAATDGGNFLSFQTPEAGFNAAKKLITSSVYSGLTVDQALKKWSNSGYNGSIVPSIKAKTINQLTPAELDTLIQTMARNEGYYA